MMQQQMQQQYNQPQINPSTPFNSVNNNKPLTGLTPGTIYAQPNPNYNNPFKTSNVQEPRHPHEPRKSNVGIGSTPPKSILTPNKNKPKSPGMKKVKFADQ